MPSPVSGDYVRIKHPKTGKVVLAYIEETTHMHRNATFRVVRPGKHLPEHGIFIADIRTREAHIVTDDPPVKRTNILSLYLDAAEHRAAVITGRKDWIENPSVQRALRRFVAGKGLTLQKRQSK